MLNWGRSNEKLPICFVLKIIAIVKMLIFRLVIDYNVTTELLSLESDGLVSTKSIEEFHFDLPIVLLSVRLLNIIAAFFNNEIFVQIQVYQRTIKYRMCKLTTTKALVIYLIPIKKQIVLKFAEILVIFFVVFDYFHYIWVR